MSPSSSTKLGRGVVGTMILRSVAVQIQIILLSIQSATAAINQKLLRTLRQPLPDFTTLISILHAEWEDLAYY